MKIKLPKISFVLIMIVSLSLSGISPVLVNALPQSASDDAYKVKPILVTFGSSLAEQTAIQNFLDNFPNSKVIDFIDASEIVQLTTSPVVYIGHSSENGIMYNNDLISWNTISELISSSKSNNHYILGCDSQTISDLTAKTGKSVVSFDYDIDAIVGSGLISIQIAQLASLNIFTLLQFVMQTISRVETLNSNPDLFLPMRLGGEETYTMGVIALTVFIALWPCTSTAVAISAGAFAYSLMSVPGAFYTLISTIVDYINGKSVNFAKAVDALWAVIDAMADVIITGIAALAWWKAGAATTCFSADTASNAVATVAKVLLLAAALAVIMSSMLLFIYDYFDYDYTFW